MSLSCMTTSASAEGEIECPNCGELLEFDFSGLFDGEDIKELEECDGACDGCDGCEGEETE